MRKPVVIIHGYSDKSNSFEELADFLKNSGFNVVQIWLADYLSMHDEITIDDIARAMGNALRAKGITQTPRSFDAIVHSTGGLVVRAYLRHYFRGRPEQCPIFRLIMLAPANFGSHLATLGKSMLGRLFNGWKWDGLFQTGTKVLEALELASPISWQLAIDDLFNETNSIFRMQNLFTTILVGTTSYGGKKEWVHEVGSDGTVRASAANLNSRLFKLRISQSSGASLQEIPAQYDPIAFAVLFDQNHGTITKPIGGENRELGALIIKSLSIEKRSQYEEHIKELSNITTETFQRGLGCPNPDYYHEYLTINMRVRDQFGEYIPDYFVEFYNENEGSQDPTMKRIHGDILEKVKVYSNNGSYRSFLFDMTDFNKMIDTEHVSVDLNITVAARSKDIFYASPKLGLKVLGKNASMLFSKNNSTILIDVEIERLQSEKVFRLRKY